MTAVRDTTAAQKPSCGAATLIPEPPLRPVEFGTGARVKALMLIKMTRQEDTVSARCGRDNKLWDLCTQVPVQHLPAPSREELSIQDPPDLAREGQPSILVLLIIEEASAPRALDEIKSFLAGAISRKNAFNAAALVEL